MGNLGRVRGHVRLKTLCLIVMDVNTHIYVES